MSTDGLTLPVKKGVELTVTNDIIDFSGNIIFSKGQKVTVTEVWKDDAHWSNVYDWWIPEKIHGFKLEGHYGWWLVSTFEETKDLK